MKVESNRESLTKLGITTAQSIQKDPFNTVKVACICRFTLMTITEFLFLITEAEMDNEYVAIWNSLLTLVHRAFRKIVIGKNCSFFEK